MALTCASTGEYITHGSDGSLDGHEEDETDGLTVAQWSYLPTVEASSLWHAKSNFSNGWRCSHNSNGSMDVVIERSTDVKFSVAAGVIVTGWNYVCWRYLSGRTGDDGSIVWGNLTTKAADLTDSIVEGEGGFDNAAAEDVIVGNVNVSSFGFPINGDVATFMMWNAQLTIPQMIAQQFSPYPLYEQAKCVLFSHYYEDATVPDWSGSDNSGTPTGTLATASHVPLGPPFGHASGWMPGMVAAAAGTGSGAISLAGMGGLAGSGGLAGPHGGLVG